MIPVECPVCYRVDVKPLFDHDIRVTADVKGESTNVSGLVGFICDQNGHVFFVRRADIEK